MDPSLSPVTILSTHTHYHLCLCVCVCLPFSTKVSHWQRKFRKSDHITIIIKKRTLYDLELVSLPLSFLIGKKYSPMTLLIFPKLLGPPLSRHPLATCIPIEEIHTQSEPSQISVSTRTAPVCLTTSVRECKLSSENYPGPGLFRPMGMVLTGGPYSVSSSEPPTESPKWHWCQWRGQGWVDSIAPNHDGSNCRNTIRRVKPASKPYIGGW